MGQGLSRNGDGGAKNLAGRYRLIAELGQGGMATVYLAVALGTSGFRKLAVVKLLRPEIAVDQEFVQMFLDEARLCARLSHPNIVQTYDVGVDEVGHLMAMEYLDGVSLHAATAKLARKGGQLTFPMQARVLLDVIEGLRYAHELKDYDGRPLNIVHRDVTPHNIFVTFDGQVKLLDFGIAKAATSSVRTATGVIKGKLTYMAPEQARGDSVDARADLYAVGVMLWEAVTGRRRWPTGLSQPALFTRLAAGEPPESPDAASRGFPPEIDAVVLRAMATKPEDRFQTAAEFRDALEAVMRGLPPVSLRDLGAMLGAAFEEGRLRLRDVVEEQFRAIDAGGHPSMPHMLPAVVPPSLFTGSASIQGALPATDRAEESLSRRMTAPALVRSAKSPFRFRSRIAIVFAVLGVGAMALAFAIASHGARSSPGMEPAVGSSPALGTAETLPSANPSAVAPAAQGAVARDDRPDAASTLASQTAEAGPRVDWRNRSGGFPAASHGASVRPVSAAPDVSIAPSAAPAPGPSASPTNLPHSAQTRPKVQLERDNPWP
ncbi:MAG TPA: protein kinase [Polyangiaceae bacterium]|nr:protein kinase [Polyangiaceae bacterium]